MSVGEVRPDETVHYLAIARLQSAYADIVTRRAWPELTEVFLPDAAIDLQPASRDRSTLIGPIELADSIAASIPESEFFEFVVLNAHVELSDGAEAAKGRLYMCAFRSAGDTLGVYHDRYRRVDYRWWIAGRRYEPLVRSAVSRTIVRLPRALTLDD